MRITLLTQAILLTLLSLGGAANAETFSAGAGRANIQIPAELYPIQGFIGEHDPLAVRVLLLDDSGKRIGIIAVDQTSISDQSITDMKAILNKVAGVAPDNAIVCAVHSFSAPHVLPVEHTPADMKQKTAAFKQTIDAAVLAAATEATSKLQPARLGFGAGTSRVNVNRDIQTEEGWWLGADDAGYADPSLAVIRIDTLDGKPLALLMNEAVQSSIMDQSAIEKGGRLITADLAGAATHYLEAHDGSGAVAMFLIGAAGDQAPYLMAARHVVNKDGSVSRTDIHETGFTLVDLLGERLGAEALQVSEGIKTTAAPKIQVLRQSVELTSQVQSRGLPTGPVNSYVYHPGAKVQAPVVVMRIGDIALVGVQAELSASTGAQIKARSPFPHTIVLTMVDGAAKYMPDAASYDRFTYEARNSRYAQGSAEAMVSRIVDMLKQMHNVPVQNPR